MVPNKIFEEIQKINYFVKTKDAQMKKLTKTDIIRLAAVIIFIVITVAAAIFSVPLIKELSTEHGRTLIIRKVQSFGAFGWLLFLGLQILQVIVALIPGEPVEILGGILFGTFGGFSLCSIGALLGTIIVFHLVKKVGYPLVYAFVPPEKIKKFKFLNDEKKLETVVFILYLIPGTPKDALTYIVPLTDIKPLNFFILITLARIPSIISSTFAGANLAQGNWVMTILIFVITASVGLIGIYYNEYFIKKIKNKNKKSKINS